MTEKQREEALQPETEQERTHDDMIDQIAARVLEKYRAAFEELAK